MAAVKDKQESFEQVLASAELVYDSAEIARSLDKLAAELNQRLQNTSPLVLCVMQGGIVFTGHMLTRLRCMPELDYIHASRYRNQTLGKDLEWLVYPRTSLEGRTVLVLDDILDEGLTLQGICDYCIDNGAKEVITAVLLHKKHDRCVDNVSADYVALEVKDRYVFGFGMDYKGQMRHLDSIYALPE